eukprot:gb/GECH01011163.1/.p1 GENE.gb/GECH01011163.1/~~gb/GECH01011163.1/.p1  ORF type:complete len:117 (+),score=20.44 gb/GECH01011163.1/:1-351(+)
MGRTKNIRVHYRRKNSYNTKSNRTRLVRTPGGRLAVQYVKKTSNGLRGPRKLGHKRIHGVRRLAPRELKKLPKHKRTVSRAYGGTLTHDLVRERIIRAFLIEEQKIVKQVMKKKRA